jgi:hypothetical protein
MSQSSWGTSWLATWGLSWYRSTPTPDTEPEGSPGGIDVKAKSDINPFAEMERNKRRVEEEFFLLSAF